MLLQYCIFDEYRVVLQVPASIVSRSQQLKVGIWGTTPFSCLNQLKRPHFTEEYSLSYRIEGTCTNQGNKVMCTVCHGNDIRTYRHNKPMEYPPGGKALHSKAFHFQKGE